MLTCSEKRSAFYFLPFQICGIHFELPHQLFIDEQRRMHGLGLVWPVPVQGQAQVVFAIDGESVHYMERMVCTESRQVVVRQISGQPPLAASQIDANRSRV